MSSVRFKAEGDKVLFILNGVLLAEWPADKAAETAKALISVAKVAEAADAKVIQETIEDQALMIRSGFMPGLSLTQNPRVFKEAKKHAEHDRSLRRYLPSLPNVPSGLKWGLPRITRSHVQG